MFAAELVLFETCRHRDNVFYSRKQVYRERTGGGEPPGRGRWPLAWVWPTLSVTESDLLHFAGLDLYVMVRYVKLCWKLMAFATVVCCTLLVPCYVNGDQVDVTSEECNNADNKNSADCTKEAFYTLVSGVGCGTGVCVGWGGGVAPTAPTRRRSVRW